jgi:hypothetical protein
MCLAAVQNTFATVQGKLFVGSRTPTLRSCSKMQNTKTQAERRLSQWDWNVKRETNLNASGPSGEKNAAFRTAQARIYNIHTQGHTVHKPWESYRYILSSSVDDVSPSKQTIKLL